MMFAEAHRMTKRNRTSGRLCVEMADEADRQQIYQMRHAVYARELRQHPENEAGSLTDPLDVHNTYITVRVGDVLAGFVSITPPEAKQLSIDKYIKCDALPFPLDDSVYEVRLLTVAQPFRGSIVPGVLIYAALRFVEEQGGTRVVAIGRREVMALYRKLGMHPLGVEIRSGEVTYALMHSTVETARTLLPNFAPMLRRIEANVDWQLEVPFDRPTACYHGGAFFEAIGDTFETLEKSHDVINADVLDAWFEPSPKVLEGLRTYLPWLLRTSPPTGCEGLVHTIAQVRGVNPENILPGAGSSDLIYLALRQWLSSQSRVLILDPMYGEYSHLLERVIHCQVDRLTLSRADGYTVDLDDLTAMIATGPDLVILVNPNNPTGRHVQRDALIQAMIAAPAPTRFWIDETYLEYAGADESLEQFAAGSCNIVVCKSMSKVYALSGARVAYLCGPAELVAELRPLTPPWVVSLLGQVAAVMALKDPAYYANCYAQTHHLRRDLAYWLRDDCGLDVVPGVANFLLCHLPGGGPDAKTVVQACRAHNLFIRDTSNISRALGARTVRIAVKDAVTNRRMCELLQHVLQEVRRGRLVFDEV